ncbi:MAG: hypothetical protein ACR2RF_10370 [Geminicoccaceae bacterium]
MSELRDKLIERRDGIGSFLADAQCLTDQRHLDAGTSERDYWHYGYAIALQDIIDLLGTDSAGH